MTNKIFTSEQNQQREQAVKKAELRTSGEIVVITTARSGNYRAPRMMFAFAFALLSFLAIFLIFADPNPLVAWAVQIPAFILGYILAGIPPLHRRLAKSHRLSGKVHNQAVSAFHAHGLSRTKDHTGILIFVSVFERRVEVLADQGINSKLSQETWDNMVQKLIARIKVGEMAEGLCQAVAECGDILSKHFPRSANDVNELSDKPIES